MTAYQIKKISEYKAVRIFIRKKLIWYILPNLLFNGFIPYYSFENPASVSLFKGEFCFARFILPMALFIPLAITVDLMKKTTEFILTAPIELQGNFEHLNTPLFLRLGLYNGLTSFLITFIGLLVIHWLIPQKYTFNGMLLASFNGILACLIAVYYTFWSAHKLDTLIKKKDTESNV
ncbi:hypothetical protein RYH73_23445 [Olivibacter sp. CPCC 100613]|uniref:hypothetical protein n=1 Tax=Olivibacter sp. CPCC 100613 TaxID=3079931 RepID=UPI002FFA4ED6